MHKDGLLLSFYGDDFTGSTDAMEALAMGGVPTVLFTRIPDEMLRDRFAHCRAIGLAGASRSEPPAWMDENLTPAFAWLKAQDAAVTHYKVCSTFDSSPKTGNIGRAAEIGRAVFGAQSAPILVGVPQIKRATTFGNLFAAYRDVYFRIDRHPVMSRHPVTPMDEADLRLHLAKQTALSCGLIDIGDLRRPDLEARVDAALAANDMVLFDVADPETQRIAGDALWRACLSGSRFVIGSSGVEYALLVAWRALGLVSEEPRFAPPRPADRIAVVSGSVSPMTERQISQAAAKGFAAIALDPLRLVSGDGAAAIDAAVAGGLAPLRNGQSVVLYTALGPSADRGAEMDREQGARHRLGRALGDILRRLVLEAGLMRAVIAGGDTSSHALGQLGVDALTVRLPLPATPGAPLCLAHSALKEIDGLELAMKGGQLGGDDYFSNLRDGIVG